MKRAFIAIATAAVVVGGAGWTTAVASEEGWFAAVHHLELDAEHAQSEAGGRQRRIQELDSYLSGTLADAETAQRATRELRSQVATDVVHWDEARRRAERMQWSDNSRDGRMLSKGMEAAKLPATEPWRSKVALLSQVSDDVEASDALLVHRGKLDVEHAFWRGQKWSTEAERQAVIDEASAGEASGELASEIEAQAATLSAVIEELEVMPADEDFHRRKGALLPPVSASPTHGFGPRPREDSNTKVRHTGFTYAIDPGADVQSVAAGRVVVAERFPGFGRTIIVDHGGQYHSVYAHLDELSVELGDVLEARTVVGTTGESGSLEGPKLYFELRRQGQPVDPAQWFVR